MYQHAFKRRRFDLNAAVLTTVESNHATGPSHIKPLPYAHVIFVLNIYLLLLFYCINTKPI